MMAIENFTTRDSNYLEHSYFTAHQVEAAPDLKRKTLQRCCRLVKASCLSGSEFLVEYLFGKYIKNHSHHSVRRSCTVVLSFLRFLEKNGQSIYVLTRKEIGAFVEFEQVRGLKTASIINNLEAINTFLSFLVKQNVLPHSVRQHEIKLKKSEALPRAIPKDDVQLLLGSIRSTFDRALILLLLRTGMRIGELLNVKLTDIIFRERKILIYQGEKNYQGRVVYYSKDAAEALQLWLQQMKNNAEHLFVVSHGKPISYTTAYRIMKHLLQDAKLEGRKYSLHSLRHTFATDMLNAGMRIEVLQQLLGHQEIGVTMRYAKLADPTREREYFQAMDCIEQGEHYEPERINNQLQKVFEEKKLLSSKCRKLSK
jgi:integrase/recombinase XerD